MSQGKLGVYQIEVSAAALAPLDIASRLQVGDDLMGGPLGYAYVVGNLTGRVARVVVYVAEDQPVIGMNVQRWATISAFAASLWGR